MSSKERLQPQESDGKYAFQEDEDSLPLNDASHLGALVEEPEFNYQLGDEKKTLSQVNKEINQKKPVIEYDEVDELIDHEINGNVGQIISNNRKMPKFNGGNKFGKFGQNGNTYTVQDHEQIKIEIKMQPDDFLQKQHTETINGHQIYFPFKPYQCQNDYMNKIIEALKNNENALLESPTGTGKTLSLLCAALSWLKSERDKLIGKPSETPPKIIYTSRTHSQLAQVQKEMKNTAYKPRTVIIASRDHMCVNSSVNMNKGTALNAACRSSQKAINPCMYFKNRDMAQKRIPWEPLDIEDLHMYAKREAVCPYYGMKDRVAGADLVFMPYNYLIDEKIRENFKINFENAILIFDEGHNIPQVCEDSSSFSIGSLQLEKVLIELAEVQDAKSQTKDVQFESTDEGIQQLKILTGNFKQYIENYDLRSNQDKIDIKSQYLAKNNCVLPGQKISEIFFLGTKFNDIDDKTQEERTYTMKEDFDEYLSPMFDNVLKDVLTLNNNQGKKTLLEEWFDILKKVMRSQKLDSPKSQGVDEKPKTDKKETSITASSKGQVPSGFEDFYIYIYDEEEFVGQKKFKGRRNYQMQDSTTNRKIGFWCFNASSCMNSLAEMKPRSILLTSGTLSPLDSFQAELGLPFKQRLENPHVIDPKQVMISVLSKGITEQPFNFSYQNRDNNQIYVEMGKTMLRVAEKTPGGILMFFPSYFLMEKCHDIWSEFEILWKIDKLKTVLKEPKDSTQYQQVIERYYGNIFQEDAKGALLMGVCRGRISEGLDFADNAARCVVVVGIPNAQMTDPKVLLKQDYLDRKCRNLNLPIEKRQLKGKDWYQQQATRAVNQAIGRVIRHVQDYGQIILMDERFGWNMNKQGISKWLRSNIQTFQEWKMYDIKMRQFYQQMASKGFVPKVQQLEQLNIQIDEDGEQALKLDSKKKYALKNEYKSEGRTLPMFGQNKNKNIKDGQEPVQFGFVPKQMTNKNKEAAHESSHNTISKMFKNAPPPKPKDNFRQRPIDDISQQEVEQISPKDLSKKKQKIEFEKSDEELKVPETKINLSKYRFQGSKTVNTSLIEESKPIKTNFGISNSNNIVAVKSSKSLVSLMKECLQPAQMKKLTDILQDIKKTSDIQPHLKPLQELFFEKFKDPKTALHANGNFECKVQCIQKLGYTIPQKLREAFFNHFDKILEMKFERLNSKKDGRKTENQGTLNFAAKE